MTATPQPESKSPSRRALLAGALGGLGALAASAFGRVSPARAGSDGDVVLQADNPVTSTTTITNSTTDIDVFHAVNSHAGLGLFGSSIGASGILGTSDTYIGIDGRTFATNQAAIRGWSRSSSTGVQGYSNDGTISFPAAKAKTGVHGYANQDTGAVGVWGESSIGLGVYGKTATGYAGYFNGKVFSNAFYELGEIATPAAPVANRARLFVRDTGLGKTQLCVRFHTGVVKVLATEP